MMKIPKYCLLFLIPIFLTAGCVQQLPQIPGLWAIMGPGEKAAPAELLEITKVSIIPKSPVDAEQEFSMDIWVKNLDEKAAVKNTKATLYNWGKCHLQSEQDGDFAPSDADKESATKIEKELGVGGMMYPGASAVISSWNFKAPTNEELGLMSGRCPLDFMIDYTFNAITTTDVNVISEEALKEAARKGERPPAPPAELSKGRGPLKIDLEFSSRQPLKEGSKMAVTIRLRNVGRGSLEKINWKNDVKISSSGLLLPGGAAFEKDFGYESDACKLENKEELPMVGKESIPVRCFFNTPDLEVTAKTYYLQVKVKDYKYTIFRSEEVRVEPILE